MQQKKKTGKLLRLSKKNFEDEEMQHELFLRTRQTTKTGLSFANNMSSDIKLSKAQITKINESGGSFGCNLRKKSTNKYSYSFR